MARYLDTAKQLNDLVEAFAAQKNLNNADVARIGEIINLAIRCCPRGVQHTVRKNIVETAIGKRCFVSMTEVVESPDRSYHRIEITPRSETPKGVLTGKDAYHDVRGDQQYPEGTL